MAGSGVRGALPRWLTVVLGIAGTAVAVLALRVSASIVAPILLALVLTVVAHPVIDRLQRRGAPSWLAVGCAVVLVDGVLVGLVLAVVLSLGQLATVLPTYSEQWDRTLDGLRSGLSGAGVGDAQIRDILHSVEPGAVTSLVTRLLGGLVGAVGGLVFVLATVVFMCADAATLPSRLSVATAPGSPMGTALHNFARRTRSYIVVTTVFGAAVAALDTVALLVMGIPLALLWGLLSFITNYVPNIGFVIGLLPPTLLGLLVGGWPTAVLVVVVYSIINAVLQSLVQPAVVGDVVGLSVPVSFLSLIVWGWVLGPLGTILAVPLTLLVQATVLETDPDAAWARALVSHPTSARRRPQRPGWTRRRGDRSRPAGPSAPVQEGVPRAGAPEPADGVPPR